MKIAYLNTYSNGSTGRIIGGLKEICHDNDIEAISIYSRGPQLNDETSYRHHCKVEFYLDALCTRFFDAHGLGNIFNTISIIRRLKRLNPDIIHLHNLHGYWINYPLLFLFIKKQRIKVIWTFHDCWHFTGHCTHFDYVKCDKWKNGCNHCIQTREFPSSYLDFSARNYSLKKKYFTSVKEMIIVTPSAWLKEKVKQSFLKDYRIEVIHNGIDISVFKPSSNTKIRADILKQGYHAIVLGVAATWTERKGLEIIQEVAKKRNDCFFVVIGSATEEQRLKLANIIYIDRTENVNELKDWYSAADVLAQPTLEDTYPTTNLEAIACGTPVVTFATGGSEEIVLESGCGLVTKDRTAKSLEAAIDNIVNNTALVKKQSVLELDSKKNFQKYIELYNCLYKGS